MENQIVISCGMLMDEVKYICGKLDGVPEIIWLKRAMHKEPSVLKKSLQQVIDENQNRDAILLTYGLCGNGTLGLVSRNTKLVIPRFHDCIHQLLGCKPECGHYYLTRGWTLDREELYQQTRLILQKYGETEGRDILNQMYDGYMDIDVIDTGAYPVDDVVKHAEKSAGLLKKRINKIPGSTVVLEKLLTGNWDEDVIVLETGEKLELSHFI